MQLKSLGGGIGFLKAGFLGFAGSGKTYTAATLACGLRKRLGLAGPIALFDTELAAQYVAPMVKRETGIDLIGHQSRSFDEAIQFFHAAVEAGASVIIFDSVTHIWQDLARSFLAKRNEVRLAHGKSPSNRLEFQDWAVIKNKWASFSDLFLNAPQHVIICGRAGYEWDFEEREDEGGKVHKELVKTGVKMKAEGEFGFEPSLLIQMSRVPVEAASAKLKSALYVRRAEVIKDRFGVIDGLACDNPTFDFFKPYVECLVPGQAPQIDMTPKTDMGIDDEGQAREYREKKRRVAAVENFSGLLMREWPGMSAQEKLAKSEVTFKVFGTRSWTEVESMPVDKLEAGLAVFDAVAAEYKSEVEKKAQAEAAAEADAKASKKAPKKAEEVKA